VLKTIDVETSVFYIIAEVVNIVTCKGLARRIKMSSGFDDWVRCLLGPCTAAIDVCPFGLVYISPMIDDDEDYFLEQLVE
jgi:hypothetical protein